MANDIFVYIHVSFNGNLMIELFDYYSYLIDHQMVDRTDIQPLGFESIKHMLIEAINYDYLVIIVFVN